MMITARRWHEWISSRSWVCTVQLLTWSTHQDRTMVSYLLKPRATPLARPNNAICTIHTRRHVSSVDGAHLCVSLFLCLIFCRRTPTCVNWPAAMARIHAFSGAEHPASVQLLSKCTTT
jgi:hypothetical protein